MIDSGPALVLQPTASPVTATTSAHRQPVSRSARDRPTSTAGRHIGSTRNRSTIPSCRSVAKSPWTFSPASLEKLHRKDHDDEHDDIQQRFRQALADPSLSLRDRVRMACSLGAVFGGLLMPGDAFDNVSSAELGSLVRDAVRDIVAGRGA